MIINHIHSNTCNKMLEIQETTFLILKAHRSSQIQINNFVGNLFSCSGFSIPYLTLLKLPSPWFHPPVDSNLRAKYKRKLRSLRLDSTWWLWWWWPTLFLGNTNVKCRYRSKNTELRTMCKYFGNQFHIHFPHSVSVCCRSVFGGSDGKILLS